MSMTACSNISMTACSHMSMTACSRGQFAWRPFPEEGWWTGGPLVPQVSSPWLPWCPPGVCLPWRAPQPGAWRCVRGNQRDTGPVTPHQATHTSPILHTVHCTQHTSHCTLLHTAHHILHTAHCSLLPCAQPSVPPPVQDERKLPEAEPWENRSRLPPLPHYYPPRLGDLLYKLWENWFPTGHKIQIWVSPQNKKWRQTWGTIYIPMVGLYLLLVVSHYSLVHITECPFLTTSSSKYWNPGVN